MPDLTKRRKPGRPTDGEPAIAGRSRTNGNHLGYCEGHWAGTPTTAAVARAYTADGAPLELIAGFRPVTPEDGALVYATAVMVRTLGPVDWATPPPEGLLDPLCGSSTVEGLVF